MLPLADRSPHPSMLEQSASLPNRAVLSGAIRAYGLATMRGGQIAEFRRKPGPIREGGKPIPPTLLKASDEQTVASVSAMLEAVAKFDADRFNDWGIIAAPRFPGRAQLTMALDRFAAEGVWGVSPHLIPHFGLHSAAGTLSLALGIHGPNLGIGGGTDSAIQGTLTALTWLEEGRLPGVWLVLSGHCPEYVPGLGDVPATDSECQAIALALVAGTSGPRIRIVSRDADSSEGPVDLVKMADWLGTQGSPRRPGDASSIYRPHLRFPNSTRPEVWTLATDRVSGLRVELVANKEDSR